MGYLDLPNGLRLHDGDWTDKEEMEFYDRQRHVIYLSRQGVRSLHSPLSEEAEAPEQSQEAPHPDPRP